MSLAAAEIDQLSRSILRFEPNLRTEPASAQTGYTWGKSVQHSNILEVLRGAGLSNYLNDLDLAQDDIVAERWLVSDDPADGSLLQHGGTKAEITLRELLDAAADDILGSQHIATHGPYLHCIMKQLDTNTEPTRGSLSVQVHPKPGHPTRPAKPEMWTGQGKVYLGWKQDVTPEQIREAHAAGTLESLMNDIELDGDCILVDGGTIHAIRYDSFLYEWSMAPAGDDVAKGSLKDATVAPYDRTDGKTQRPGKEKLEESIELLQESEGMRGVDPEEVFTDPEILEKSTALMHWRLFTTPHVVVEKYRIEAGERVIIPIKRAMPIYVDQGSMLVSDGNEDRETMLRSGREALVPYALEMLHCNASMAGVTFYTWHAPITT